MPHAIKRYPLISETNECSTTSSMRLRGGLRNRIQISFISIFILELWYSKNKVQQWYLCSETKPELDLKNIILKVFGSRYWSISEYKLIFYFHPCNSSLEKVFRCRARSVQNTFKSLWFALLIDFWIQINFLFSSLHPLAWKTISMQVKKSYSNICFRAAYSKNKIQKWYLCSETNPELDLKK